MSSPYWKNKQVTLETAKVHTSGTYTGADFTNERNRGVTAVINVTAFTGTNYVPKLQYKDELSGVYVDVVGAAVAAQTAADAASFVAITAHPDATARATAGTTGGGNVVAAVPVSRVMRLVITFSALTTITFNAAVLYHV